MDEALALLGPGTVEKDSSAVRDALVGYLEEVSGETLRRLEAFRVALKSLTRADLDLLDDKWAAYTQASVGTKEEGFNLPTDAGSAWVTLGNQSDNALRRMKGGEDRGRNRIGRLVRRLSIIFRSHHGNAKENPYWDRGHSSLTPLEDFIRVALNALPKNDRPSFETIRNKGALIRAEDESREENLAANHETRLSVEPLLERPGLPGQHREALKALKNHLIDQNKALEGIQKRKRGRPKGT